MPPPRPRPVLHQLMVVFRFPRSIPPNLPQTPLPILLQTPLQILPWTPHPNVPRIIRGNLPRTPLPMLPQTPGARARVRPRPAPVEPQQGGAAIKALERGWGGWRLRSATPPLPRGPATKFNLSTRRAPRSRGFSLFSVADPRSPADMPARPPSPRAPSPGGRSPCRPPRFPDQSTSRPADRAARAVKI